MRIPKKIQDVIKEASKESFDTCEVILFGSRVDDAKKGGDFDIAIKGCDRIQFRRGKIRFFKRLLLEDMDLPIDLVHYESVNKLLQQEIDTKGVKL